MIHTLRSLERRSACRAVERTACSDELVEPARVVEVERRCRCISVVEGWCASQLVAQSSS